MRQKITIIIFVVFIIIILCMPTQSITKVDLTHTLEGPSAEHWFGTDNLGRDVFSLMIRGCARTLLVVFVATAISLFIGTCIGLIGGFYGGIIETIVQFIGDFSLVIPSFIAALVFTAIFGFSPIGLGVIFGIMGIGEYIIQVLILTKQLKNQDYITGEHITGIKNIKIIFRSIFPNLINPLFTFLGNKASTVILGYAGLAYIGLGADVTNPDWGSMIYQYRMYIVDHPLLVVWPTIGIFILALFFHLMFDNTSIFRRGKLHE